MRRGIRASQDSSAERGEFGSTSARSNRRARSRRATENTLSPGASRMVSLTAGWWSHSSRNFSGASSVMWASGNFSRKRSSAGVVITASPSQFVPRTRILSGCGFCISVSGFTRWFGIIGPRRPACVFLRSRFPAAVNPEPVGRVAAHGGFEAAVDVAHDVAGSPRPAVFVRGHRCRRVRCASGPGRRESRWRCTVRNDNAAQRRPARAVVEQSWPKKGPRRPFML